MVAASPVLHSRALLYYNQSMEHTKNRQRHEIPPVFDERARILILGSFPSVRSREGGFFYHHPRNRFWEVLAAVYGEACPRSIGEKKAFLLRNGIALWDVAASCEIEASADSSMRNVLPNDISVILREAPIERVYLNGGTAYALYRRLLAPKIGLPCEKLPSTSPANAAWSLERLIGAWKVIREYQNHRPEGVAKRSILIY